MSRKGEIPARIGTYDVVRRIEGGSDATELFVVRDREGRNACLKRVHPSHCDSVEFVARFDEELTLARRLHHRNLVEVYDHGEDLGHYLVMEFVDGPNLADLLADGSLTPPLVVYIGVELCRALAFIHHSDPTRDRPPLIHCDVTPHNVLIDRASGGIKLADFGLAKALAKTGEETLTRVRGKTSFLSPEQYEGNPVSSRADLFSLGLVLWRALVGTHPFMEGFSRSRGLMLDEWLHQHTCSNERRSIHDAAPHAPRELRDAIEGLLQPVGSRIPTAEDVFGLLRHVEPLDGHVQLARWVTWLEGASSR